jgi:hypothetical protein
VSKPKPGDTAPKDRKILAWGQPNNTEMLTFYKEGWHTAVWDEIDQSWCLTGGTCFGPFIKPVYWLPVPPDPS